MIESFAAECYPSVFEQKTTIVLSVAPERTFWEKATILHQEANRPKTSKIPLRYFRHYYDLYCLASSYVKQIAFLHIDLLKEVVKFKMKFYPRKWANYSEAKPGSLRLVPPDDRIMELHNDYDSMKDMFYGVVPTFESVIQVIKKLEEEINNL